MVMCCSLRNPESCVTRRHPIALIFGAVVVLLPTVAWASSADGFLTGADLLAMARQNENSAIGYVTGVIDATLPHFRAKGALFCLPKDVKPPEVARKVLRLIERDPKSRSYQGASSVIGALATSYPCQK